MDEFKGNAGGEVYQLAVYDKNHRIIEILKDRKAETIKKLLNRFVQKPKVVSIDMFKPFRGIIRRVLKDADIVAYKYHVIRQGNWMLRDLRRDLFNKHNIKYKDFKKYWKLLSKNPLKKLSDKQKNKIQELLSLDTELNIAYNIIKEFNKSFEPDEKEEFRIKLQEIIYDLERLNIKESIKLSNTLRSWEEEIGNIIKYKINNGFVEGKNNKIKVIKRISYGIKNFDRQRKLLLLRLCNE